MFCLPIRLWVVPKGETDRSTKGVAKVPPNLRDELGSSVRNYVRWDSMDWEYMLVSS